MHSVVQSTLQGEHCLRAPLNRSPAVLPQAQVLSAARPRARYHRIGAARPAASAATAEPPMVNPATVPPVAADLQQRAQRLGAKLKPVHRTFGVAVEGLDMEQPLGDEEQTLLLDAWRQHDLLLFRGQELSPAAQQRILETFPHDPEAIRNEEFCNWFFRPRIPAFPLLSVKGQNIDLDDHHGIPGEELRKMGLEGGVRLDCRLWHMDLSDVYQMPEVSAMYMVLTPPEGGETEFASTATAYENLDADTQELVRGLKMVNAFKGTEFTGAMALTADGTRRTDDIDAALEVAKEKAMFPYEEFPPVPFVIQDEATGRLSLLASVQRMHHFVSHDGQRHMSRQDSLDLLERILKAACAESEVYSLRWQPNDFAVWANRRLIHTTTPAKHYDGETRMFHLVFLDAASQIKAAPTN